MFESQQHNKSLVPRNPSSPLLREKNAIVPNQTVDWEEIMRNINSVNVTQLALDTSIGQLRVPEARLPGLTVDIAKETSNVVLYELYVIETSSLYYEHRDGYIDDVSAQRRAEEITQFYEDVYGIRSRFSSYFQEKAAKIHAEIPKDLEDILIDPKKLKMKYSST